MSPKLGHVYEDIGTGICVEAMETSYGHVETWDPRSHKPLGSCTLQEFETRYRWYGSGTTGAVAERLGRDSILIELNPEYVKLIRKRIGAVTPGFRFDGDGA